MPSTLKDLPLEVAAADVDDRGAAFVDVRNVDAYLEVHIPGSLNLQFESGPGFNVRARDCIPLKTPLVLVDLGSDDLDVAAAALRGKGFTVLGSCSDAINRWAESRGAPASTEVVTGSSPPDGVTVLDVADPNAKVPEGTLRIPADGLWARAEEIHEQRIAVAAGYGVRASLAVGILEYHGARDVMFWRTRSR